MGPTDSTVPIELFNRSGSKAVGPLWVRSCLSAIERQDIKSGRCLGHPPQHHSTLHTLTKYNLTLAAQLSPLCDSPPMTNVIRPCFSRATDEASEIVDNFTPLQIYGKAVGHFVALIRAESGEAEETLQLIVGQETGVAAETVAILPDTVVGEVEAEAMAHAILRTLAIVRESFVGCAGSSPLDP